MTLTLLHPSTSVNLPPPPSFFYSAPPRLPSCLPSLTVEGVAIDKSDPATVEALVGQTVVLPCRVSPPPSSTVVAEWRRDGVPLSTRRSAETPAQPLHRLSSELSASGNILDVFSSSFLQASPAAQRFPARRPSHEVGLGLVLVRGHSGTRERPPLHLPVCHR